MFFFLRWVIRGLVIVLFGGAAANMMEEHPVAAVVIGLCAVATSVWMVVDILHIVSTW